MKKIARKRGINGATQRGVLARPVVVVNEATWIDHLHPLCVVVQDRLRARHIRSGGGGGGGGTYAVIEHVLLAHGADVEHAVLDRGPPMCALQRDKRREEEPRTPSCTDWARCRRRQRLRSAGTPCPRV